MKYKRPETTAFAILISICFILIVVGLILAFNKSRLSIVFLAYGIIFGVMFLPIFIISLLCYLLIDDIMISFPLTRSPNSKFTINRFPKSKFKRNKVLFSEINYVESRIVKGSYLLAEECFVYNFRLKSGESFEEILYPYGKKQEQEIVSAIRKKVKVIQLPEQNS